MSQPKEINNAEFADYIQACKTGGSYLLREKCLFELEVDGDKVSGTECSLDTAFKTFSVITTERNQEMLDW